MNIEEFRDYCLSLKGVTEHFPFDPHVLVFKVMDKMFALTDVETFDSINLKCDPERAIELRERYHCVIEGYHMNKKHWNTINIDGVLSGELTSKELKALILHSYELVVRGLPKKVQKDLEEL